MQLPHIVLGSHLHVAGFPPAHKFQKLASLACGRCCNLSIFVYIAVKYFDVFSILYLLSNDLNASIDSVIVQALLYRLLIKAQGLVLVFKDISNAPLAPFIDLDARLLNVCYGDILFFGDVDGVLLGSNDLPPDLMLHQVLAIKGF